jgi:hypothetical protein
VTQAINVHGHTGSRNSVSAMTGLCLGCRSYERSEYSFISFTIIALCDVAGGRLVSTTTSIICINCINSCSGPQANVTLIGRDGPALKVIITFWPRRSQLYESRPRGGCQHPARQGQGQALRTARQSATARGVSTAERTRAFAGLFSLLHLIVGLLYATRL